MYGGVDVGDFPSIFVSINIRVTFVYQEIFKIV